MGLIKEWLMKAGMSEPKAEKLEPFYRPEIDDANQEWIITRKPDGTEHRRTATQIVDKFAGRGNANDSPSDPAQKALYDADMKKRKEKAAIIDGEISKLEMQKKNVLTPPTGDDKPAWMKKAEIAKNREKIKADRKASKAGATKILQEEFERLENPEPQKPRII